MSFAYIFSLFYTVNIFVCIASHGVDEDHRIIVFYYDGLLFSLKGPGNILSHFIGRWGGSCKHDG